MSGSATKWAGGLPALISPQAVRTLRFLSYLPKQWVDGRHLSRGSVCSDGFQLTGGPQLPPLFKGKASISSSLIRIRAHLVVITSTQISSPLYGAI